MWKFSSLFHMSVITHAFKVWSSTHAKNHLLLIINYQLSWAILLWLKYSTCIVINFHDEKFNIISQAYSNPENDDEISMHIRDTIEMCLNLIMTF